MSNLPCEFVQDLFPAYIDGKVSAITKDAIEKHLESCEGCSSLLQSISFFIDGEQSAGTESNEAASRRGDIYVKTKPLDYLKKNHEKKMETVTVIALVTLAVIVLIIWIYL